VVTTISARPLLALLPDDALPRRLMRRLRIWRYAAAAFKIDYALRAPVPWTAPEGREAAVVHVAGGLPELAAAAEAGARGEAPERPALVVGQHTLQDGTRAPAGQHTLYCYAHVPARYDCGDDDIAARIESQLERFAPGFSESILARAIRNPRQTEEENPSLVGGDLAGGSYELDQQLIFRPAPSSAGTGLRCAGYTSREPPCIPAARCTAWAAGRLRARCWPTAGCARGGPDHPGSATVTP
jgi:phytoene dehydrogenase-like protein